MKLKSVYVRFYKSFNYDYLRKIKDNINPKPWEFVEGQFYPFVEVALDPKITTIVGANESGKSHLLSAIEKGITGKSTSGGNETPIGRKDFCRYSHLFRSTTGGPRYPDIGLEWSHLTQQEKEHVCILCKVPVERDFERFFLFRQLRRCRIYLHQENGSGYDEYDLEQEPSGLLPHVFRIQSDIALPDSVSILQLIKGRLRDDEALDPSGRSYAFQVVQVAPKLLSALASLPQPTTQQPGALTESLYSSLVELRGQLQPGNQIVKAADRQRVAAEFNLAYDLIFQIANIDVEDIKLMYEALRDGETGVVRSVVDNINAALATKLNFPRVWAQDREFALRVEATEHELSFVISDRTGRQYSFDERSSGLKHFLSYYIQYLVHEPRGTSELLLMDEPDAFLSGEAQQDLLKVFQMFAGPMLGKGKPSVPVQVVYVTHSPFLIDKNHAERVRAVEKAEGSKGTRVIAGASQNHYEPLRSAFGAFIGETTFISQCNLMVEGTGDQILLAGAAAYLRQLQDVPESELLDLNRLTIVPAGGATNVPYLVYLARGRDAEKPAVMVLLDSDKEGNDARADLSKDGPHPRKKQVLEPRFIVQLGDIRRRDVAEGVADDRPFRVLEDLVPPAIAVRAARIFVKTVYELPDEQLDTLSLETVRQRMEAGLPAFDAIQEILSAINPVGIMHFDKVPFSRTVIDLLPDLALERVESDNGGGSGLNEFEGNMRSVFRHLREVQTATEQETRDKRMRQKVEEKIATFLNDFGGSLSPVRDDAVRLLYDIQSDLEGDDSERTYISQQIIHLRAAHGLGEDLTDPIRDLEGFLAGLERLRNAKQFAYLTPQNKVASRKQVKQQESSGIHASDALTDTAIDGHDALVMPEDAHVAQQPIALSSAVVQPDLPAVSETPLVVGHNETKANLSEEAAQP